MVPCQVRPVARGYTTDQQVGAHRDKVARIQPHQTLGKVVQSPSCLGIQGIETRHNEEGPGTERIEVNSQEVTTVVRGDDKACTEHLDQVQYVEFMGSHALSLGLRCLLDRE